MFAGEIDFQAIEPLGALDDLIPQVELARGYGRFETHDDEFHAQHARKREGFDCGDLRRRTKQRRDGQYSFH